ncbi:MAG TPA: hypothetical protein VM686_09840, partial [Polyangiaceae bacterium]|nr:hypothetical protein [Polyangiaceae bacterium]
HSHQLDGFRLEGNLSVATPRCRHLPWLDSVHFERTSGRGSIEPTAACITQARGRRRARGAGWHRVVIRDFAVPLNDEYPYYLFSANDTISDLCNMTTDDEEGPWFDFSLLSFDWASSKGDDTADVRMKVRYAVLSGRAGLHRKHCSAMTRYLKSQRKWRELTFEGNGHGWVPTPATESVMSKLGDPYR